MEQILALSEEVRHPSTSSHKIINITISQERIKLASSLKALGNTAYQSRSFERAIELYTRAIKVSAKPEPVFYSNRAACKNNLICWTRLTF